MLQIEPRGSNQTVVYTGEYTVLFSYRTAVACFDVGEQKYYRTAKRWSVTTSKHINRFLSGAVAEEKPQEFFDSLV